MGRLYSIQVMNGLSGEKLLNEINSIKENLTPLLFSGRILIAQILCAESMIVGKLINSEIIWTTINYDECNEET